MAREREKAEPPIAQGGSLIPKSAAVLVLFVMSGYGQNCIKYGAPITLAGTLLLKDEAGYNQFVAVKLTRPICAVGNPKDTAYPGTTTTTGRIASERFRRVFAAAIRPPLRCATDWSDSLVTAC